MWMRTLMQANDQLIDTSGAYGRPLSHSERSNPSSHGAPLSSAPGADPHGHGQLPDGPYFARQGSKRSSQGPNGTVDADPFRGLAMHEVANPFPRPVSDRSSVGQPRVQPGAVPPGWESLMGSVSSVTPSVTRTLVDMTRCDFTHDAARTHGTTRQSGRSGGGGSNAGSGAGSTWEQPPGPTDALSHPQAEALQDALDILHRQQVR
jgi:hypothetical protein